MLLTTALLALCTPPSFLPQADWPRFRGPDGTGVLPERGFPGSWGPDENVAWAVEVAGSGWSSPVVVGGRIYLTAAVDPGGDGPKGMREGVMDPSTRGGGPRPERELTFRVTCLGLADGELVWSRDVGRRVPAHPVHRSNTFATETPASDGERLFVTFGALGELVCLDLDGAEQWRVETGVFPTGNDFGWGISLVAHGGLVFLQNDNEEASFVAAFDARSGERRWRAERPEGTSWGTPLIVECDGGPVLVACGPDSVLGYAAASGEELWRVEGLGGSFSSSPTHDGERVYLGNSGPMNRGPLLALAPSARGKIDLGDDESEPPEWVQDRSGPGFASPVVVDGLVYVLASSNILACHDAGTGEPLWRERLPGGVQVVASPWVAGDELYVLDEEGTTVVVRTGPEFEVLRTNRLEGLYWATPSVAGDALLVRESGRLYCIRE